MSEKNWAVLSHLSALAMFIIPLGNVIGPLVIYLWKKDEIPVVEREAGEALNFQITVSIGVVIAWLLTLLWVGYMLLGVLVVVDVLFVVMAALETNRVGYYRYPFNLRLMR